MTAPTYSIHEGYILAGPLFNEPMRVVTVRMANDGTLTVGLVGTQSELFRKVVLTPQDIEGLTILDSNVTFDGNGHLLRLGLQAYSLGIAWEFDPYFGLSISRVDPLPHQLEAIYDYLLKLVRVRFLLADDAGAGKTIMAGLLIRELQLRGLAERILIVCPANLSFQWQRELKEKFDEKFLVLKGGDIRDQFGVNQWLEQKQVITSLDLAKRTEILPGLRQVHWDLVIVDEAHRMSWTPPSRKTARYALGELLRDTSDHMLILTATPHKGDPANFSLFLQPLDEEESSRELKERLMGKQSNDKRLYRKQAERFRWSKWRFKSGTDLRDFVRDHVFPYMASLAKKEPQIAEYFRDAVLEIFDHKAPRRNPDRRQEEAPHRPAQKQAAACQDAGKGGR